MTHASVLHTKLGVSFILQKCEPKCVCVKISDIRNMPTTANRLRIKLTLCRHQESFFQDGKLTPHFAKLPPDGKLPPYPGPAGSQRLFSRTGF